MSRRLVAVLRVAAAVGVPILLLERFGTGPFSRALDLLTWQAIGAAALTTVVATACCAARWTWTARRLDLDLDLRAAFAAYYRSLFLNQVLPGGVLGDVDRAVRHGTTPAPVTTTVTRAARAVVWERLIGQLVLVAVAVLVVVSSRLHSVARVASTRSSLFAALVVVVAIAMVWVGRRHGRAAVRTRGWLRADVERLLDPGVLSPLALSGVAVIAHLVLFEVAMRVTGVDVAPLTAVPMLLLVLLASSLPLSLAGWGPREGAAAWAFAASGLGATSGVTVAAVYGILSLLAALPGGVLVMLDAWPRQALSRGETA